MMFNLGTQEVTRRVDCAARCAARLWSAVGAAWRGAWVAPCGEARAWRGATPHAYLWQACARCGLPRCKSTSLPALNAWSVPFHHYDFQCIFCERIPLVILNNINTENHIESISATSGRFEPTSSSNRGYALKSCRATEQANQMSVLFILPLICV